MPLQKNPLFLIRDYLYETTGMYFPDSKQYFFENRFKRRLQKLNITSYREYLQFLQTRPAGERELTQLIQEITINETSFFRNEAQFKAMVDLMIPAILPLKQNGKGGSLRIWSAGCSTGEEPYSIALYLLHYCQPQLKGYPVEILATDIDAAVLETAKKAVYRKHTLRNVPEEIRHRFFRPQGSLFVLDTSVKKLVTFKMLNLIDSRAMASMGSFDLIFCRNVLIYFSVQSKKQVLEHFYHLLFDHGSLFLGHSESLFGVTDKFKLVHFAGGMAYKKVVG